MCVRGREHTASAPGLSHLGAGPPGVFGPPALVGSFQPPPGLPPPSSPPKPFGMLAELPSCASARDALTGQIPVPVQEGPYDLKCLRGAPAAGSCLQLPGRQCPPPAGAGALRSEAELVGQAGLGAQLVWSRSVTAAHSAGTRHGVFDSSVCRAVAGRKGRATLELPELLGHTSVAAAAGARAAFDGTVKESPDKQHPGDHPPCQENRQQSQNLTACLEKLSDLDSSRLFVVRGLHKLVTELEWKLRQHFSGYGAVSQMVIVQNRRRRSWGNFGNMGFILMYSAESVERILAAGREHRIGGATVVVQRFEPRQRHPLAAE